MLICWVEGISANQLNLKMFYLQKDLTGIKEILDFYVTPNTEKLNAQSDGNVISWDKANKETRNSIILPSPLHCKLDGVEIKGKQERIISNIRLQSRALRESIDRDYIRLPLSFYHVETESDHTVLASIEVDGKSYPGIVQLTDDKILFTFDPGEEIRAITNYRYIAKKSSGGFLNMINSLGAIVATKIPLKLRNYIIKKYLMLIKGASKDTGFPNWPMDNSVDVLRDVFLKTMVMVSKNNSVFYLSFWPENKKWCFCSTHDVDTKDGFNNMSFVRNVEKKYKLLSTWYITHEINPDINFLQDLEKEGCEIGSHGWVHDDCWRSLSFSELENRFKKSTEQFKDIKLAGFRAPYNEFYPKMFQLMQKYFLYDASAQETRIYGSVRAHRFGCCTLFPYEVNGIMELPLTIPPDYLLINTLNHNPAEVYDVWEKKLYNIISNEGMALMQTHPEEFDIGNDRFIEPYEKILDRVNAMDDCWIAKAKDVAEWWRDRRTCRIAMEKEECLSPKSKMTPVIKKMELKNDKFINLLSRQSNQHLHLGTSTIAFERSHP